MYTQVTKDNTKVCEKCGAVGAYDFVELVICIDCVEKILDKQKEEK